MAADFLIREIRGSISVPASLEEKRKKKKPDGTQ